MSRQMNCEDTTRAGQITDCQFTLHCFETAPTDVKAQSKARAISAGLNEGQHQFFGRSLRETATMILDFDGDTISGRCARSQTSVWRIVNLNALCRRLPTVAASISASAMT